MAYIVYVQILQGQPPSVVVNHRSGLYTNCTNLKRVLHIVNMVRIMQVQRYGLYTYTRWGNGYLQLSAWAGTYTVHIPQGKP